MNQAVVYRPVVAPGTAASDCELYGLWSPRRSAGDVLSLRDYLASRPNVCFQCHDMPSLLPNISVPSEIVVGSSAATAIDLSPSGMRQPQACLPALAARHADAAASSSPQHLAPTISSPQPLQLFGNNTRKPLPPLSTVPYVESLPAFPKAVAAVTVPPPPQSGRSGAWGGWPTGEAAPPLRQPVFRDVQSTTASNNAECSSRLLPLTHGGDRDAIAGPAAWPRDRRSLSPDGGRCRVPAAALSASPHCNSASPRPFAMHHAGPLSTGVRHSAAAVASTRTVPQRLPEQQASRLLFSPADGQPAWSACGQRSFPDFVRDTIANFVHRASPDSPPVLQNALGRVFTAPHLVQNTEAATGRASLQRIRLPHGTDSLSPRAAVLRGASSSGATDAAAAPARPVVGGRSLLDLLLGTTSTGGSAGDIRQGADRISRKRKADDSAASVGGSSESQLTASSGVCPTFRSCEDDCPLDLSMKASPSPAAVAAPQLPHSPPPPTTFVGEASGPSLPPAGSPVALAKKNLHPVTSRVSECLVRSVQKAARIASALGGVDARDKASLVCSSWHRLLLWLLAEENFTFVVVPLSPVHGRAGSPSGSPSGPSLPPSPTQPVSCGRQAVPTVGFVQAVMSFIDKCHSLRLDRIELDLLFSITLFHLDGQDACSGALAERLIHQTRLRLMDELLQHTTAAASAAGQASGAATAGVERYTQLLLSLPSLYAIDVRTFEVLFCERLAGPAADMRLLLMDIVLPLLH